MKWMFYSAYMQRRRVHHASFPRYSTTAVHAALHAAALLLSAEEIAHSFILLPLTLKELKQKNKHHGVALPVHIYMPKYIVKHHHTLQDPPDASRHQHLEHHFKIMLHVSVIKYRLEVKHPFHYNDRYTLLCTVAMVTDMVAIRFMEKCIPKSGFLLSFFCCFFPSCMAVSNYLITMKTQRTSS